MNEHLRWTRGDLLFLLLLLGALFVDAMDVTVAETHQGITNVSVKTRVESDEKYCESEGGRTFSTVVIGPMTRTKCIYKDGTTEGCNHFESSYFCWNEVAAPEDDHDRAPTPEDTIADTPFEPDRVVTPAVPVDIDDVQLGTADLTPAPITPEPTIVPVTISQG